MIDIVLILVVIVAVIIGTSSKNNSYMRFTVCMVIGLVVCSLIAAVVVLGVVGGTAPVVGVFSMGVCMLPHVDTHVHDVDVWYDAHDGEWVLTVDGVHYASTVPTTAICTCAQVCTAGKRLTHMERMQ